MTGRNLSLPQNLKFYSLKVWIRAQLHFFQPCITRKSPSAMISFGIYLVLNSKYLQQLQLLRGCDFRILPIFMWLSALKSVMQI